MSPKNWQVSNDPTSVRYRVLALVATVGVGGLIALLLAATAWNPVVDVPSAPHSLIKYPDFASDKQLPPNPFYDTPEPLPDVLPGTLLKSEKIDGAPEGIRALRLMYMSTTTDGKPVPVSALYLERTDLPQPSTGRPLMGLSHGTTGLSPSCGMSQGPFTSGTTGAQFWIPEMKPLLDAGYTVVATDYQNMGVKGIPSYLVAQSEAYAVLDSMRAAVNVAPNNIDGNSMGLIGHSQGGQASLAAAQYHAEYAPELAIRGVVSEAPGMVVGLPIVAKTLVESNSGNEASRAEYISFLTESWSRTYPDRLQAGDVLTKIGVEQLPMADKLCGPPLAKTFTEPFSTYVRSDFPNEFLRIANENVPDSKIIGIPMLMTQGAADDSIVPQFSYATFRAICRTGTVADLRVYPEDDHNSLLWTARSATVDWLNDRMAGKPAPNGCEGRN